MFKLRKLRGLRLAGAAIGLISAACVTHYNKPPADSAAHALGPAGHGAPPGLTNVRLLPPPAGPARA